MIDYKQFYLSQFNANPDIPIIPNAEKYAFMFPCFLDLHLLFDEPNNRQGMILRELTLLYNISDFLMYYNIKNFAQLGDLTDSGKKTVNTFIRNMLMGAVHEICDNRNAYILYGNHEETYKKYNLFFEITDIQSEFILNRTDMSGVLIPTDKCFKAIDKVSFGPLNIYFMHFDKEKQYYIPPSEGINVVLFHDDILTLESKNTLYHHKKGMGIDIENTNLLDNVDVIICGHIHIPMQPFRVNNLKHTLVIIPGDMSQRTRAETHEYVDVPVLCLTPDAEFHIEYARFLLGSIEETINTEKDETAVRVRQMNKEIKKYRDKIQVSYCLDDFLQQLDPDLQEIIHSSDKEIIPNTVKQYYTNKY